MGLEGGPYDRKHTLWMDVDGCEHRSVRIGHTGEYAGSRFRLHVPHETALAQI